MDTDKGTIESKPSVSDRNWISIKTKTTRKLPRIALSIPKTMRSCHTLLMYVRPDQWRVVPSGRGFVL
ncbi:MAG: hypothetical protein ACE5I8_10355, partial [Thermodesulfobacteriota bacterium]